MIIDRRLGHDDRKGSRCNKRVISNGLVFTDNKRIRELDVDLNYIKEANRYS